MAGQGSRHKKSFISWIKKLHKSNRKEGKDAKAFEKQHGTLGEQRQRHGPLELDDPQKFQQDMPMFSDRERVESKPSGSFLLGQR